MYKAKESSEKGITLTALVVYMVIMVIIIGIMTTISSGFFKNVYNVIDTPQYLSEMNKFIMFFGVDIKNYNNATVTSDTIQFENGPTYKYQDGAIFRNDLKIAEYIMNCDFTMWEYTSNSFSKDIINVSLKIGESEEEYLTQNIDFTLKYW